MTASFNINFLVSEVRHQEIKQAAEQRETTVSAWLREAIREKLEREKAPVFHPFPVKE